MAAKKAGRPVKTTAKVKCLVNNVWTSEGKLTFGDEVELPKDEADMINEKMMERLSKQAGAK